MKYFALIYCAIFAMSCSNESFFNKLGASISIALNYNLSGSQTSDRAKKSNSGTPAKFFLSFSRIELLSSIDDTDSYVIFSPESSAIELSDLVEVPPNSEPERMLYQNFDGHQRSKQLQYLKIYYNAFGVAINVTNFSGSLKVNVEEFFYTALNNFNIGSTQYAAGSLLAFDRGDQTIKFLDKTKLPTNALVLNAVRPATETYAFSGTDNNGNYFVINTNGYSLDQATPLRIKIDINIAGIFSWDDASSETGTFDGNSNDIFNWRITSPALSVKLEKL